MDGKLSSYAGETGRNGYTRGNEHLDALRLRALPNTYNAHIGKAAQQGLGSTLTLLTGRPAWVGFSTDNTDWPTSLGDEGGPPIGLAQEWPRFLPLEEPMEAVATHITRGYWA